MSKKHFERLAAIMSSCKDDFQTPQDHKRICNNIADICAMANSLFNRSKFLSACGVES